MNSLLNLENKTIVVIGIANKRSVAYAAASLAEAAGATVIHVVRDETIRQSVAKLLPGRAIVVCDAEKDDEIQALPEKLREHTPVIHGLVHSIAFANYSDGMKPFHETRKEDFLQAVNISCFSLTQFCNVLKPLLAPDASIVTISISTTTMAAENYGYMAPIKAALDSSVVFLAKSLGQGTQIRVNAVGASLLKTSASAGIPGYIDSYLFAEKVIPRRKALGTDEVGKVILFLLSDLASGITAQKLIVDAGMSINYFDREVVRAANAGGEAQGTRH